MTLDELKRLEAAATPGPWELGEWSDNQQAIDTTTYDPRMKYTGWEALAVCNGSEDEPRRGKEVAQDNAALIAAMRNALPDLLAAVELLADMGPHEVLELSMTHIDERERILSRLGVE